MKKIYLLCITSLLVHFSYAQQWKDISPFPDIIYSMQFVNDTTGFVASKENILKTTDGGATWVLKKRMPSYISVFYFPTPLIGYLSAQNGPLYKTTDGGETWSVLLANSGYIYSMHFPSPTVGYYLDGTRKVMKTTDGGVTWSTQDPGSKNSNPHCLYFSSVDTGFVCIDYEIFRTVNGGTNWTKLSFTSSVNKMTFVTPDTGFAVGDQGRIIKTVDRGQTWSILTSSSTAALWDVCFVNSKVGYAGGGNADIATGGVVLKTTDGGTTWKNTLTNRGGIKGVFFTKNNKGIAAGGGRFTGLYVYNPCIYSTTDAATTWKDNIAVGSVLKSCFFHSSDKGFFVGGLTNGLLIETSSGGDNLTVRTNVGKKSLNSICFPTPTTGYIVGDSGTLLKTTNGGLNWNTLNSGTTNHLNAVFFIGADTGYAAGGNVKNIVLKTTDGGLNWKKLALPDSTNTLLSLYFNNTKVGHACGKNAVIFRTTNGGASWTKQIKKGDLHAVVFTSPINGYMFGSIGVSDRAILTTTDTGATWNFKYPFGGSNYLTAATFPTATIGYAVGGRFNANPALSDDLIIKTTDAGKTWTDETSTHKTQYLRTVHFPNLTRGYAAGDNISIYKYTGTTVSIEETVTRENGIIVYPNPGTGKITVKTEQETNFSNSRLVVYSLSGQEIKLPVHIEEHAIVIHTNGLAAGMYILKLITGDNIKSTKLIIE
jgi:photosystem II stability/assembly factor-like uncharacterized protein